MFIHHTIECNSAADSHELYNFMTATNHLLLGCWNWTFLQDIINLVKMFQYLYSGSGPMYEAHKLKSTIEKNKINLNRTLQEKNMKFRE